MEKKITDRVKKVFGNYPEKVLQFGEGNFLRAFVDWMIELANRDGVFDGSIVLCQPIQARELKQKFNAQDGLYTLVMRGIEDGEPVEKVETITSVSRCIDPYDDYDALMAIARSEALSVVVSNTTEAGISYHEGDRLNDRPPVSFPAKVTVFLYERFRAFHGDPTKGLLFLPVELIDNNGSELKRLVLRYAGEWQLEEEFLNWVENANYFTNTLVDRIVTGYPRDEKDAFTQKLGYEDPLIVTSELFNLWVIEGDKKLAERLPVHKTSANVIWTDDVKPYKKRKVRILNGAHTSTVPAAYLSGFDIVLDFMKDETVSAFMNKVIDTEVIPTLDLPKEDLEAFAKAVNDRFANPYIRHRLLDISLNSSSKFTARCLPSLMAYVEKEGTLPPCLTFSLAAFLKFYQGEETGKGYVGTRIVDGLSNEYAIRDDKEVLDFIAGAWALDDLEKTVETVLSRRSLWGDQDLTQIPNLTAAVSDYLKKMDTLGIKAAMKECL